MKRSIRLFSHRNTTLFLTALSGIAAMSYVSWQAKALSVARDAPFTVPNLVIYRVGNGSAALNSNAAAVFLDEYTMSGGLAQSIPMPTTISGSNKRLTASGTATSEGLISRSRDGRFLTLSGYDADVGTAGIATSSSATINRVIGRIDANGSLDTSTALTDAVSGGNPRSTVSTNGTDLWIDGSVAGVRYAMFGATTSIPISTTFTDLGQLNIFGGQLAQLYVSAEASTLRLGTVGSGTPTGGGQIITSLPGFPTSSTSPYGFLFVSLARNGLDTVYVADDNSAGGTGGIRKYSLVAGSWASNGTVASAAGLRGLTGFWNQGAVTLYATSPSALFTLTDSSGYNAPINGTLTSLATAGANTAFRGVAFAPASTGNFDFTVVDSPGSTNTVCGGINNSGHIVGGYTVPGSPAHGFLDVGGTFTTIDHPSATAGTLLSDINNNSDQIIGAYDLIDAAHPLEGAHGFLLSGGVFTTIEFPAAGVTSTTPSGVNDSGDVVGLYRIMNGPGNGFRFSGGTYTQITVGTFSTHVNGINNAGLMVGQYKDTDNGPNHGFLKDGSTVTTIDFPGADDTILTGINSSGDITGTATTSTGAFGFLKRGAAFYRITDPAGAGTQAGQINDGGEIVGFYFDTSGLFHGFRSTFVATSTPTATPTSTATSSATMTPTSTPTATNTSTSTPTPAETPSFSGRVTYGDAQAPPLGVSGASVCAVASGFPTICTGTDPPGPTAGQYTLTGFVQGAQYTVGVTKTTGQNGISSNDSGRIAQHVAGIATLQNNPQKVAADVSNNGTLSSNDAALIARFVAGLGPPIGITNTWRFFAAPGPTFPVGASPTTYTYDPSAGVLSNQDFVGVLEGEVTGNWNNTGARSVEGGKWKVDSEGSGPERGVAVELPSLVSSDDKEIVVPVSVQGVATKGVISFEFALRYDPSVIQPLADPVDVNGTASRGLSVVTNGNEPGLLRVVVYGAMPINDDGVLLNLRFTAVGKPGSVSPLSFERIMFNEGEPRVTMSEGRIELF